MSSARPFEPTGMTTAKWLTVKPCWIQVAKLIPTQDGVFISGIRRLLAGERSYSGDDLIHVVVHKGTWWISDGHHRYVIALVRNDPLIYGRVIER